MERHLRRIACSFVALTLTALALSTESAHADEKSDCLAAHESGQVARRAGHFAIARQFFAECQADACPSVVRTRCADFARELEAAQPSAVVVVTDVRGGAVSGAQISIDGGPLGPVRAMALRLDPGNHTLHVEAPGLLPADKTVTLFEGLKEMLVPMALSPPASAQSPPSPPSAPPVVSIGTTPEPSVRSESPTLAWALAVTSGVTLAGAGALSAAGWVIHGNLKGSCGSTPSGCSDNQVEPLRILWPASFISLGVGVVSAIVSIALFASHKSASPQRPTTGWVFHPAAAEMYFP
jgi:hypothetical protein